ncbi:MAG: MerR family transcriptional regulator [Ignavibacteriales bacterium]|jgi:DNA-binding transcriptional MerR regulator|nr:MerR family transcriptional regulator [Ignavibacteriaceae bacterium]NLH62011.1 MerR family transcriptional regulator [Ignavibacteriales bacterium]
MKDFNLKKLYYSISEVSRITDVEQYILRYWETEFSILQPQKNRSGNRVYTNKDIKLILFIKSLLREKKFTVEGAKEIIANYSSHKELFLQIENLSAEAISNKVKNMDLFGNPDELDLKEELLNLKQDLLNLLKLL